MFIHYSCYCEKIVYLHILCHDQEIKLKSNKKEAKLEQLKVGKDNKRKFKKYNEKSAIDLIHFIRDQDEHYSNWAKNSDLASDKLFGKEDLSRYRAYFMSSFPELTTLLYNCLLKQDLQGVETKKYFLHIIRPCLDFRFGFIIKYR